MFLAPWGRGVRGEAGARVGAVCESATITACHRLVTWMVSFHLASHALAFALPCGANTHRGCMWNKVEAWYPGMCLHPLLGKSLSWGWAGRPECGMLAKVRSPCSGLLFVVSLLFPLLFLSLLYPPEKAGALHPALLLTHCASWQIHNLTFFRIELSFFWPA